MTDQAEKLRSMASRALEKIDQIAREKEARAGECRVITVTSGKGGVGKTFLSVNLGLQIARQGKRVLLFDADLGLSNVNVQLGLMPLFDLGHFARGQAPLEKVICPGPSGMDVLSGGSGLVELYSAPAALVSASLAEISRLSSRYDLIIVDTGAGLSNKVQRFLQVAEDVLLVTTTEPTAITDAYAVLKYLALKAYTERVWVVVNMADDDQGTRAYHALKGAADSFLERRPEMEFAGVVPRDQAVAQSVFLQRPVTEIMPASRASRSLQALAKHLAASLFCPAPGGQREWPARSTHRVEDTALG